MIEEFLKEIKESFSNDEANKIEATLGIIKNYQYNSNIYNFDFALKLASVIFNNKLGSKAVMAGLYFPFIKEDINKIPNFNKLDEEIKNLLQSLNSIENLNLSTKEEQLDSIKKMFMGIAKEMRVVIIKLLIEALKLEYLDKFTSEEIEN